MLDYRIFSYKVVNKFSDNNNVQLLKKKLATSIVTCILKDLT